MYTYIFFFFFYVFIASFAFIEKAHLTLENLEQ